MPPVPRFIRMMLSSRHFWATCGKQRGRQRMPPTSPVAHARRMGACLKSQHGRMAAPPPPCTHHLGLRLGCGVFGHVDQLQRLALESMWRASCQEGLCLLHTVRKLGHVLRVLCQGLMLCHVELKRSVLQRPHHHCVKLKFGSPLLVSNVPQLRHLSHAAQWKTVVQLHLSRQGAPQLLLLPVDDVALVAFHVVDAPTERVEHGPVHSPVHEVFDLPHRHRAQRWRVACNGAEHHRLEATVAVVLHELAQALLVLECGGAPFHLPLSLGLQDDRL
mmetsp:Transcript_16595/g.41439  ORF Transcript_16595/g.41439 Transcript_16595/m.41439 type:complete len:275 (+) Transcript_16595:776-1600(+)